jgi:hypothetical protein
MAWKNHEDETLITNKQHDALSAEEKIKFYQTSDEVVASTPKTEKNGKGQELDTESSES